MTSRIALMALLLISPNAFRHVWGFFFSNNYHVILAGGGDFTSIQSCANAMAGGDTCTVHAGNYSAENIINIPAGSSGAVKTIQINGDDLVTVKGFTPNNFTSVIGGNTPRPTTTGLHIDNHTAPTAAMCVALPDTTNHVVIQNTNMSQCGANGYMTGVFPSTARANFISYVDNYMEYAAAAHDLTFASNVGSGVLAFGDNWLLDGNEMTHMVLDINASVGSYKVIRRNIAHHQFGTDPLGLLSTIDCVPGNGWSGTQNVTIAGSTVTATSGGPFYLEFPQTWVNLGNGGSTKYVVQSVASDFSSIVVSPSPTAGSTTVNSPGIGGNCHGDILYVEPGVNVAQHILYEENIAYLSLGNDNKLVLFQGQGGCGANGKCDHAIVRFNVSSNMGGGMFSHYNYQHVWGYNNTFKNPSSYDAATDIGSDTHNYVTYPAWAGTPTTYAIDDVVTVSGVDYISLQNSNTNHAPASSPTFWSALACSPCGAQNTVDINNIFTYDVTHSNIFPAAFDDASLAGSAWGYSNAIINSPATGSLYSHTTSSVHPWTNDTGNVTVNPLFVSPSSTGLGDLHLQAGSTMLNAGHYLATANGSGSSSTALTLSGTGAYAFQDGWGMTSMGVQPDWICVGTVSNCAQISSINYATGVVTLASPLSWSNVAPAFLKRTSSGTDVLTGTGPNMGALSTVALSATPTSLRGGKVRGGKIR